MRIIAGKKRGKKITEKFDETTRPTTDRVRENVFNVILGLCSIEGANVLDLFAGSGAYGLESFSRGAGSVVFNDADKQACEVIKKNCKAIECNNAVVLNLDYRDALSKLRGKNFDIVFLDPPYQSSYMLDALQIIAKEKMLSENGIIVAETEKELPVSFIKSKKYGRAWIYFLGQQLL